METNRIYDRYRPTTWDEVLGNADAVATLRELCEAGQLGGQTVLVTGPSGAGKTTLCRIAAQTLADSWFIHEYDRGEDFDAAALEDLRNSMNLMALGKGGRAWIINELHGMKGPIVRALLGVTERLPRHCAIFFTTTLVAQRSFFDGVDDHPLMSRCFKVRLSNQGLCPLFAGRLREVALAEGYDVPLKVCEGVVKAVKNNLRDALTWIGSQECRPYRIDPPDAALAVA